MRQAELDSNSDKTARKDRRPAFTFVAGLIALAIATAVILDKPRGDTSASSASAAAPDAPATTSPAEEMNTANTSARIEAARPHFERSNEPVFEDTTNPHGG